MKKTINKKVYDTDKANDLGCKYCGDFGTPYGYEERLFVTKTSGQHFLYGVGGCESKYAEPLIEPLTDEQAAEWKKENGI